jgi:hypothetical protein
LSLESRKIRLPDQIVCFGDAIGPMVGLTGDQALSLILALAMFKDGMLRPPAPETEPAHSETETPESATEGADSATTDPIPSTEDLLEEIRLLRHEKESALKELDRLKEAVYQLQEGIARDREELEDYRSTDGKDGRNGPIGVYYLLAEELGVEPGGSVVETIHSRIQAAEENAARLSGELTRVHAARVRAHNYWIAKVRRQRAQLHLMHQTIEKNKRLQGVVEGLDLRATSYFRENCKLYSENQRLNKDVTDGFVRERERIIALLDNMAQNDLCLVRLGFLSPSQSSRIIVNEELRAVLAP